MTWGGLASALAICEAPLHHPAEAEEAPQLARKSLVGAARSVNMPPRIRAVWNESVQDAECQAKRTLGQNAAVHQVAGDTLACIGQLVATWLDADNVAVLNQLRRQALSDAARASIQVGRFAEAETSARTPLTRPLSRTRLAEHLRKFQADDLGWARVLLAQGRFAQRQSAKALKTLEPAVARYPDTQVQGMTHVTFRLHFAPALYVQALAQPNDGSGLAQRRAAREQAMPLLQGLSEEVRQSHDSKQLIAWITAEQEKLNSNAKTQQP